MSKQRPTHDVKIFDDDGNYSTIGAAWALKDKPGISIKIQKGISLSAPDGIQLVVFRREEKTDS